jgi:hypothetical protein
MTVGLLNRIDVIRRNLDVLLGIAHQPRGGIELLGGKFSAADEPSFTASIQLVANCYSTNLIGFREHVVCVTSGKRSHGST